MFSSALVEKITLSCGTMPMRCAGAQRRRARAPARRRCDAPLLRVVEAQQQLQHGALAGAAGAHQRHRLAGGAPAALKSCSAGVLRRDG
jgi:hypothetical protein